MTSDSRLTIDQILAIRPAVAAEPPQWWDTGRQIAFVSGLSGESELWSVAREGSAPVRLTAGMGNVRFLGARLPRVSPIRPKNVRRPVVALPATRRGSIATAPASPGCSAGADTARRARYRGRCTVNVVPASCDDVTSMSPSCAVTMRSAM